MNLKKNEDIVVTMVQKASDLPPIVGQPSR